MSDMPQSGAVQVGGGYVRIGADLGPFHQAMLDSARGLQKGLDTMGSMATKFALDFGRNLAGAFGFGGSLGGMLISGGTKALELFADEEQSLKSLALTAKRVGMEYGTLQQELNKVQQAFAPVGHMTRAETQEMYRLALQVKNTQMSIEDFFKVSLTMAGFGGTSPLDAAGALHGFIKAGGGDLSRFGIFRGAGEDPMMTMKKAKDMAREHFADVEQMSGTMPTEQFNQAVSTLKDAASEFAKPFVFGASKAINDSRERKNDPRPTIGDSIVYGALKVGSGLQSGAEWLFGGGPGEALFNLWHSPTPSLSDIVPDSGGSFDNPGVKGMMERGRAPAKPAGWHAPMKDNGSMGELIEVIRMNTEATRNNTQRM